MWSTCHAGWAVLRLRFGISPPTHFPRVCARATAVRTCSSSCRDPTKSIEPLKLSGSGRSRGVTFFFRCMVNCRRAIRIKPLRNTTIRKWSLPRTWPKPPSRSRASGWSSTAVWRVFRATTRTAASTHCSSSESASRAPNNAPGRCLRLWSKPEHSERPFEETPEIERLDLSEVVLTLKAAGVEELRSFRWLEAPPERALNHAKDLLIDLGALKRSADDAART